MKRLWISFAVVLVFSFGVLGWIGSRVYQEVPPLPETVVSDTGAVIVALGEISYGQNVWQAMGGMEVGSIWGHGSYLAPDWTADWLHREATFILGRWSQEKYQKAFRELNREEQLGLEGRLQQIIRTNRFEPGTQTLTIESIRADAFQDNVKYFSSVFANVL